MASLVGLLGSVGSALAGLLANKALAANLGPASFAGWRTDIQLRDTALPIASLNAQSAVVEGMASLDDGTRAAILRTALTATAASTCLCAITLAILGANWGVIASTVLLAAFGLGASLAASSGVVWKTAVLQIAHPLFLGVATVWFRSRTSYILAVPALASVAVALALVWHEALPYFRRVSRSRRAALFDWGAVSRLASVSAAISVSSCVGGAVVLGIRARVMDGAGAHALGNLDAAWGISGSVSSLLLGSMQAVLLPGLARTASVSERRDLLARTLGRAAVASALLGGTALWLRHLLVAAMYSPAFAEATSLMPWTIAGEFLRVTSWCLSIPMIAARDIRMFLASDLATWATLFAAPVALSRWFNSVEAAMFGAVVAYAVHAAMGAAYVRRTLGEVRCAWVWWPSFACLTSAAAVCLGRP